MATGSGRLPAGKSGVDLTVQLGSLEVPWNAPDKLGLRNPAAGSGSDSRHDWGGGGTAGVFGH